MKKISIQPLSIFALGIGLISLALRVISLFFFSNGVYYDSGAILPTVANLLLILSLISLLLASLICIDKKQSVEPTSKLSQYAALLPMGAAVFHLVRVFTTTFNDSFVNKYLFAISAVFTAVFFFLIFFANKNYKVLTFYIGVGALLYVTLCWILAYFEFFIPLNSNAKTFFYMSCAAALIFIFNEMCACYGFVRAKFYYFALFSSIIMLIAAPISNLIGYFCGAIEGYILLEADIFFIALKIYAITRLIDAQKSKVVTDVPKVCEDSQESIDDERE